MVESILLILKQFNLQLYKTNKSMKRTILMTISLIALISTFIGCSKEEPQTQLDPSKCTTVTIYCRAYNRYTGKSSDATDNIMFNWIHIYDASDNLVGSGTYAGDYLVPYNGKIKLSHYNKREYSSSPETTIDTYNVGMSMHMYIEVYYTFGRDYKPGKSYSEVTSGIED